MEQDIIKSKGKVLSLNWVYSSYSESKAETGGRRVTWTHLQVREGMEFTKDGTYSCHFHCEVNGLLICLVYRFGVWLGAFEGIVFCRAVHVVESMCNPYHYCHFVHEPSKQALCRAGGLVHIIAGCFQYWSKHSSGSNGSLISSHSRPFVKHPLMPSSCKSPYPHFSNPFKKIIKNCP